MKTITETYTVYEFSELSEEAKDKAIEDFGQDGPDYDWYENVYEDAKNIGLKITSFDIDRASYCKGLFIESAENTANLILANHGEKCETYLTATSFLADYNAIKAKIEAIELEEATKEEANYDETYDLESEIEDLESEFLKSILEDYRILLTKEYEYLTSREAIIETIEANQYTFLESGEMKNH